MRSLRREEFPGAASNVFPIALIKSTHILKTNLLFFHEAFTTTFIETANEK